MLLASALGFVKLIALAYVMPGHEYGLYVSCFGIATFVSLLMSFGLTEKTTKDYPRRWVTGQRQSIIIDALSIGRTLTLRFATASVVAISLSFNGLIPVDPMVAMWIAWLGLFSALLALVGSLYRAVGSQLKLQNFTLLRSVVTICIALPTASIFGWQGAIAGDIAGSLVSIIFAIWQLPRIFKNNPLTQPTITAATSAQNGHYKLYLANLAVAPQSMLDKAWISGAIGSTLAGAYGVIMLVPQAAQLLGNVVVQHIGPLVIKLVHLQQTGTTHQGAVKLNAAVLAVFSLALTASALLAKRLPYLDHLFAKYEISDTSLLIAGFIACGQVYGLIEFHLIARDRENDVFFASLVSSFIFLGSFAAASTVHASIEWFLAGACAARWGQVWLLRRAYTRYA